MKPPLPKKRLSLASHRKSFVPDNFSFMGCLHTSKSPVGFLESPMCQEEGGGGTSSIPQLCLDTPTDHFAAGDPRTKASWESEAALPRVSPRARWWEGVQTWGG